MKCRILRLLMAIVAVTGAILLSNCAQKGNRPSLAQTPNENAPAPNDSTANDGAPPGTSDSGGGTGVDNKVFESYIVDPTTLPAYKKHLAPLFANLKKSSPDAGDFEKAFKLKTWYIAPVELEKIDKDSLGFSFMKSDTQQIARQTSKAVWIDKKIFDIMPSKEQADLLAHEFVMNLYYLKFMSYVDLCNAMTLIDGDGEGCGPSAAEVDKVRPPEPARPLNEEDNDHIRDVTGWFLANASQPIKVERFVQVMFAKGFDKRFFKPANYGPQPGANLPDLKVTNDELTDAIRATTLTGKMPNECIAHNMNAKKPCKIEFKDSIKKIKFNVKSSDGKTVSPVEMELPGLDLTLTVEGLPPFHLATVLGPEINLSPFQEDDGSITYLHMLSEWREKPRVGDPIFTGFVIFKPERPGQSSSRLTVERVIIRPGVLVDIDKKKDPVCTVRPVKATSWANDNIVVRIAGDKQSLQEQGLLLAEPGIYCSPENVD